MGRIYERRKFLGLSQAVVAKRAGLPQTTFSDYERGITEAGSAALVRLAMALDCSADYLLELTNDPTPYQKQTGITADEYAVVSALRAGDDLEAIRRIVLRDE